MFIIYALNFEYDGKKLSDYDFIIGSIDSSNNTEDISAGSHIVFNKAAVRRGFTHMLTSTNYDNCIESNFDICKDPCKYEDLSISSSEIREMMRWLNRKDFHKFRLIDVKDPDQPACFYNASFNVEKIIIDDVVIGLSLSMETDSPFGYGDICRYNYTFDNVSNKQFTIVDLSDEIGFVYPDVIINCNVSGDVSISNGYMDQTMIIKNCSAGETISILGKQQIIKSSLSSHKIANDFNFEFIKIGNTTGDRNNTLTSTSSCEITIEFSPVIKNSPN